MPLVVIDLVWMVAIGAALVYSVKKARRIRPGIPLPDRPPLDVEQTYP